LPWAYAAKGRGASDKVGQILNLPLSLALVVPHRFQRQAHDRVLKDEELRRNVFAGVCHYILEIARLSI
jgi:hypothetical protein